MQRQDQILASLQPSSTGQAITQIAYVAGTTVDPKPQANVVAAYSLWVGRVLNSALFAPLPNPFGPPGAVDTTQAGFLAPNVSPGQVDKYLKRMQFDLIYSF